MEEKLHTYLPGVPGNSRERIQDLLRENDMTQAELAEKIGMSESALSRYISGQTDKLSAESIVAIAKAFGVTTDFLLCLSDIPFTTNYDSARLGLSAKAAEKLLKRKVDPEKVDPEVVSKLIESRPFTLLISQISQMRNDTYAAGYAYMTSMLHSANDLLTEFAQTNPEDRHAAKQVIDDIRGFRRATYSAQLDEIHKTVDLIVEDFRKGSSTDIEAMEKLTTEAMQKIISNLGTQVNESTKLRSITPEMMVNAIMPSFEGLELGEEQTEQLRAAMLPLFMRPQDLAKQMKTQETTGDE